MHAPPIIRAWVSRPICDITGSCARWVVYIAANWAKLWGLVNMVLVSETKLARLGGLRTICVTIFALLAKNG